ncbi:hypothetical protein MMC26_000390 [Xylographa opegraphella]|nr:hypothetical protein [Xylographa opegraphella]
MCHTNTFYLACGCEDTHRRNHIICHRRLHSPYPCGQQTRSFFQSDGQCAIHASDYNATPPREGLGPLMGNTPATIGVLGQGRGPLADDPSAINWGAAAAVAQAPAPGAPWIRRLGRRDEDGGAQGAERRGLGL